MKGAPIQPARIEFVRGAPPYAPDYDDVYHPRAGAMTQARHVFLNGNGLPQRWQGRERFVVLETGFGLGNNFLATWQAWRERASAGDAVPQLHFISIERHPLTQDDLRAAHEGQAETDAMARQLIAAWPPLTHGLHRLGFEAGRVQLQLAFGDVADWLRELVLQADAFYLDGFAPAKNPLMWQPRLFKALARLAAPGATAATWTAARDVRLGLASAGFEVRRASGMGGKRDITLATFAPDFAPRRPPGRLRTTASSGRPVLIVGAGLAGCATAAALADLGLRSVLIDRHAGLAREASGNAGGLFHGVVHAQDGLYARFHRAAALSARAAVQHATLQQGVRGAVNGLLRLEAQREHADMQSLIARQGLPPDWLQALDAQAASRLAGVALSRPAWFHPGGGWVDPGGLARSQVERAGAAVALRLGTAVAGWRRVPDGWQLLDASAAVIDESDHIVFANAGDAARLPGASSWWLQTVRGQTSALPAGVALQCGLMLPRLPVSGAGYLLPESDGWSLFGATSQTDDDDAAVRDPDHRENLARLALLLGRTVDVPLAALRGRTAWRCASPDRLPVIGAVPDVAAATAGRLDQPRLVPRLPGLFVVTALGSRGIASSVLGAAMVAAAIAGAPQPLESSLLDALDPARFLCRAARRGRRAA